MTRTRALAVVVAVVAGLCVPAASASASCAEGARPDGQPVVFVGIAESERRGFTRFAVDEVWAGPDLAAQVWVQSGQVQPAWPWSLFSSVGSSTDADFETGEEYVVGATRSFTTDVCTSAEATGGHRSRPRGPVPGGSVGATPPVDVLALLLWPFSGVAAVVLGGALLLRRRG